MSWFVPYHEAMEKLVEVVQQLSLARHLEDIMAVVRRAARELTGADGATFVLKDGELCHYADEDAISPLWKGKRFPMAICISGWAMINRACVVIPDIYADPRIPAAAYRPTFVKSLVMVPIRTAEPIGAIGTYWAETKALPAEVVEVLRALADATSVAMENVRLFGELEARLKELEVQKEKAEAASRLKSEFLSSMSHEIRTPMNGVFGMIELALMEGVPPQAASYLTMAKQSAKELLEIIGGILDLAKIEAGKVEVEQREFSLHESFASALKPLGVQAARKGLSLHYTRAIDLPVRLCGDLGKLRQIVNNLVSNAIKFTDQGEITVGVSGQLLEGAALPDQNRFMLECTVSDTGIGIPRESLESIFESFSQVGTQSHVKRGGTGLGLAISKRFVEMMGGRIKVESEEGRGSRFTFTALFDVSPAALASRERRQAPRPASRRLEVTPLRILLVEDNPVNRQVTAALLESKGHRMALAEDGIEALEVLAREPFDLVLMDIRMPRMDGEEASRIIRTAPPPGVDPQVPIIALTAYAFGEYREHCLQIGIDDYIAKPFELSELDQALCRVMAKRKGEGEVRQ